MNTRLKHQIQYLARLNPSVEVCGVAIAPPDNVPALFHCRNVADNPTEAFQISREDWVAATRAGRPLWVYHSHPAGGPFSPADLEAAEHLTLPQWLYDIPANRFSEHYPNSYRMPPLEGRQFMWGEADCYSLLRDFARQKWGIHMGDYDRDETSSGPILGNLVLQQIEAEGFERLASLNQFQRDDILIFRTNGSPQHFGVFMGNSRVLHHPLAGLSRIDQYNLAWQRRVEAVCRYRGNK